MTTSIFLGLIALRSEEKQHLLSRDEVTNQHNAGRSLAEIKASRIDIPIIYRISLDLFPWFFFASVFSIGVFGVLKYSFRSTIGWS